MSSWFSYSIHPFSDIPEKPKSYKEIGVIQKYSVASDSIVKMSKKEFASVSFAYAAVFYLREEVIMGRTDSLEEYYDELLNYSFDYFDEKVAIKKMLAEFEKNDFKLTHSMELFVIRDSCEFLIQVLCKK